MYRLGERLNRKKRKRYLMAVILMAILLISLVTAYIVYQISHTKTTLHQSAGTVVRVDIPNSATVNYDEGLFSVSLPKTWQQISQPSSLYHIYSWRTLSTNSQTLDIYQDTIPTNFAVNRELAIQSEGNHLSIIGLVSDNCASFTKPTSNMVTGTPAKWQGVNFLCDLANYERDVVGTGSSDGINSIGLTSNLNGLHHFFFVYINNTINPDFTTFYQILNSFNLK